MSQSRSHHIPIRYKCVIPKNTHEAISLVLFAKQEYVGADTVRYWLKTRKVTGYKCGGSWYIYQLLPPRLDLKPRDGKSS